MPLYGLIGRTLTHSFSKKYFTEKFEEQGLQGHRYELFELAEIEEVLKFKKNGELKGFNITIPYKEAILPYLASIESNAEKIGAVNVVKIIDNQFHGYNSDFFGFRESLKNWLSDKTQVQNALVLGTGGASKAVIAALEDLKIDCLKVSRSPKKGQVVYDEITDDIVKNHRLIINTTPLGMSPNLESKPKIPYDAIDQNHFLYDLVYNPLVTTFMKSGKSKGAKTKNGLEMLHLQAEKSWEIWNSENS